MLHANLARCPYAYQWRNPAHRVMFTNAVLRLRPVTMPDVAQLTAQSAAISGDPYPSALRVRAYDNVQVTLARSERCQNWQDARRLRHGSCLPPGGRLTPYFGP